MPSREVSFKEENMNIVGAKLISFNVIAEDMDVFKYCMAEYFEYFPSD